MSQVYNIPSQLTLVDVQKNELLKIHKIDLQSSMIKFDSTGRYLA